MTYRLAIFDFDGTLVDSLPWFTTVIADVATEFGIRPIGEEERQALRSRHPRDALKALGVPLWKVPRIARRLRQLKAQQAERLPLFPGVADLLRDLARCGVGRAIVSSDAEANVRRTLGPESAALIGHFSCGAGLFGKPPRLRGVLRHAGVPAREAIYVGDELRDADAARAVGLAFGAVTWGYATPEALRAQAPDRLFTSVADIGAALAA